MTDSSKPTTSTDNPPPKEKKRIMVTGAGSGLGKMTALELAARGHTVYAACEIWPQVTELRNEAAAKNISINVTQANTMSEKDRNYLLQTDIDVLLNNAGKGEGGSISDVPVDVVRELFENNVFAPLTLTQGFVHKYFVPRRKGKIIWVTSLAGLITAAYNGPYCATKHALEAIAEAMHAELAPFGIQLATINPGPYNTGFNDRLMETWKSWYNPLTSTTEPTDLKYNAPQGDPAEMVQRMVQVCEEDSGLYRNLLPKSFEDYAKKVETEAWTRQQNKLGLIDPS